MNDSLNYSEAFDERNECSRSSTPKTKSQIEKTSTEKLKI